MRRQTGVATAALALILPLATFTATAATAAEVVDPPQTGFELNGGADWTTLDEEQEYLAEIDALSDSVTISQIGETLQGRPIQLVQVGSEPRTVEEIAAMPSALTVCSQHGNEPSGREGCLQNLRDVALDDSPETQELLATTTLLFVPTANPDGRAANTRGNSEGVDINRDHLVLSTNEARAIAEVVRDYGVDVVNDAHEYGPAREGYDADLLYLWSRNLNVDNRIYQYARELNEQYVVGAMDANGYSSAVYGIRQTDPPVQVAGDEDERIMRNMMGMRHVAGMLTETLVSPQPGETGTDTTNRRVDTTIEAQLATFDFFADNAEELAAASDKAADRAARTGAVGAGRIYIAGADNDPPSAEDTIVRVACSYTLTDEEYDEVADTLDLHGIEVEDTADGVSISMGQPARAVIALLVDERAEYNLVDGTPVSCR